VALARDPAGIPYVRQRLPTTPRGPYSVHNDSLRFSHFIAVVHIAQALKYFYKSILRKRRQLGKGATDQLDVVMREIAIMRRMRHPNVVRLCEVINDPKHDRLFLVLEYCERGSLYEGNAEEKPLTEDLARDYFRDLVSGILYCHRERVCHRDVKPENCTRLLVCLVAWLAFDGKYTCTCRQVLSHATVY
jgi:serine/threonine protein kinase